MRTTIQAGFGFCGKESSLYGVGGSEGQIQFYLKIKKSCLRQEYTSIWASINPGNHGFINLCNDF